MLIKRQYTEDLLETILDESDAEAEDSLDMTDAEREEIAKFNSDAHLELIGEDAKIDRLRTAILEAGAETFTERDFEFAQSLCGQYARKGSLSPKQWPWVEKLTRKADGIVDEPKAEETVAVKEIIALFTAAREHLKWPKVLLPAADGSVQFSVAGDRAKCPGTINITDGGRYPDNKWYGRIHLDGRWEQPASGVPSHITTLVHRFSANPAGVAAELGHATGNCVFCRKSLTDERSVFVGYGRTCAGHYDLPWGNKVIEDHDLLQSRHEESEVA